MNIFSSQGTRHKALGTLSGRKRNVVLFLLGVCATAALPPFFLFPLLLPAFCGLLWLIESAPTRQRAFWDGWWWGFGHFTTGLYWMCIALLTDPVKFGWLIPFTLVGLNGVIAIYTALAALAFYMLRVKNPALRVLIFASIWVVVEYARGYLFTGFPWNLIGYSWAGYDSVAQAASVFGVYGLSFVTVLAATMPIAGKRATALAWLAFALMTGAGAWRLHEAPKGNVPGVWLRIVQANIEQHMKWDPKEQERNLETYINLSASPAAQPITHIIWPETAMAYVLNENNSLLNILRLSLPPGGTLITGTLHRDASGAAYNSMAFISHSETHYFDKHHLVPFGEFVPLRNILPLEHIAPGPRDFSTGPGPRTMPVPGAPEVSPLICYEAIFPGDTVEAGHRPGWLLNITNDAWFGNSTGPYQHFYMSKMRAVEEGLPLVRAANTGISAVIDAYGRVVEKLPLGTRGVLDGPLPRALPQGTTYSRIRDKYLLLLVCAVLLFTSIYECKRFFKK